MKLAPRAVKDFLARPRKDWRWYKKLSDEALDERADRLSVRPPIWDKLRKHQKVGVLLGIRLKRLCYWYDTGTGKTLMSLALIRYLQQSKRFKRALVLVPTKVVRSEWGRELEKHTGKSLPYIIPFGVSDVRFETLVHGDEPVVIETYAGLVRLLSNLEENKKGKNKFKPSRKRVLALAKAFDTLILDESSMAGNHTSLNYRVCRKIAASCRHVWTLNATPFNRDPTPMWAQMKLVDKGETLGEHVGLFRAAFFTESEDPWSGGMTYTFQDRKAGLLNKLIANRSIQYTADESDLPDVVEIRKEFRLGMRAKSYYEKALANLRKSRGDVTELRNEFLRLRQLSSGFLGYKDDESGKAAQLEFDTNEKLELLLSLLQTLVGKHKAVVFHEYTFSGSIICRELNKLKIPHARIYGGTKDPDSELHRFTEDEACRVMVLNNAAGGRGLNLQMAKYGIYYESPLSAPMRKQTRARIVRQGSQHGRVFLYDLLMYGGVDEKILEFHKEGNDLLKAILEGRATL